MSWKNIAQSEKGEIYNENNRIVRVGTHTSRNRLRLRLRDHFITENKDGMVIIDDKYDIKNMPNPVTPTISEPMNR